MEDVNKTEARARAEYIARANYSKLLRILQSKFHDTSNCEDILSEAFLRAIKDWQLSGIPNNPEAWLIKVATNLQLDTLKSSANRLSRPLDEKRDEIICTPVAAKEIIQDAQLRLLFVCANPAIDASIRTPLMLQTIMGLDAEKIAAAFITKPSTMAQRLVRAKRKIKDAKIPFEIPDSDQIKPRLEPVLEAIYGAFAIGWEMQSDLMEESLYLAYQLVQIFPNAPEVLGLAAFIGFTMARQSARFSPDGDFLPIEKQNPDIYDTDLSNESEKLLLRARECNEIGRFQLEAAIQSVHTMRKSAEETDWKSLVILYEGLMQIAPTIGAAVGFAAVLGRAYNPKTGLDYLSGLNPQILEDYQPACATYAHLLYDDKQFDAALKSFGRAIELANSVSIKSFLRERANQLLSQIK